MKMVSNINAAEILHKRGLAANGRVQQLFTNECARYMDKYVPMQDGYLKNTRFIGADYVEYSMPYAHYQYEGVLYLTANGSAWAKSGERKHASSRALNYHGAPVRGAHWDKRMWADNKQRILRTVAAACGGTAV